MSLLTNVAATSIVDKGRVRDSSSHGQLPIVIGKPFPRRDSLQMRWPLGGYEPVFPLSGSRSVFSLDGVRDVPLHGGEIRIASERKCSVAPLLSGQELNGIIAIPSFLSRHVSPAKHSLSEEHRAFT
jgi:hypothetical protein